MLKTSDFRYQLPAELIAQHPLPRRDASRLMVLDRATDLLEHRRFTDIVDYLHAGDVLVANDSRVLPARLYGRKQATGGRVELLLLERLDDDELSFVVGHEIGHLISRARDLERIIATIFPADVQVPLVFYNKIALWEKLAELTADRYGFIASPNLDCCVTAFFKLAILEVTLRSASSIVF